MSSLSIVTPAASKLLLDPEETRERLKAAPAALNDVTRTIAGVSLTIALQLTFDPWLQEVEEGFDAEELDCGERLALSGRPFVSLVSLGVPGDDPLVAGEDFSFRKTGRIAGDVYLFRPRGWFADNSGLEFALVAQYWTGWWLPGMTGSRPAGVEDLPEDLAFAAWIAVQSRYQGDKINPRIAEMEKGNVRLRFQAAPADALPAEAEVIISRYRPMVLA